MPFPSVKLSEVAAKANVDSLFDLVLPDEKILHFQYNSISPPHSSEFFPLSFLTRMELLSFS
jgi:hypothetical protein